MSCPALFEVLGYGLNVQTSPIHVGQETGVADIFTIEGAEFDKLTIVDQTEVPIV